MPAASRRWFDWRPWPRGSEGLLALDKESKTIEDPFFGAACSWRLTATTPRRSARSSRATSTRSKTATGWRKALRRHGWVRPDLGDHRHGARFDQRPGPPEQPGMLGPAIGSAFTATLWGVLSANLIWLPVANKLKRASELEVRVKMMELEGLLAIQAGPPLGWSGCAWRPSFRRPTAVKAEEKRPDGSSSRRTGHEEGEDGERWLLTYADMITLLLALFVVLFALSTISAKKFLELANGLPKTFSQVTTVRHNGWSTNSLEAPISEPRGHPASSSSQPGGVPGRFGAESVGDRAPSTPGDSTSKARQRPASARSGQRRRHRPQGRRPGARRQGVLRHRLGSTGRGGRRRRRHHRHSRPHDPNDIVVEGYTDNQPISGGLFSSNWQLSAVRAANVVQRLTTVDGLPGPPASGRFRRDQAGGTQYESDEPVREPAG